MAKDNPVTFFEAPEVKVTQRHAEHFFARVAEHGSERGIAVKELPFGRATENARHVSFEQGVVLLFGGLQGLGSKPLATLGEQKTGIEKQNRKDKPEETEKNLLAQHVTIFQQEE